MPRNDGYIANERGGSAGIGPRNESGKAGGLSRARRVHAQRLATIGELSTGIAHDLSNMLALGLAAVQRLEACVPEHGEARAALDDLRLVSEHSQELARGLLAFARPHRATPRGDSPEQPVDLNSACADLVRLMQRLLPKTLRLALDTDDQPAYVLAPPVHIQQVLMNLLLNARDALDGAGEIHVRVRRGPTSHMLEVSDNGPGIPSNVLPRVFEPFFSVTARATRERSGAAREARTLHTESGTGMGLAIVKTIVDEAGGSIDVASRAGRTTFRIEWPAFNSTVAVDRRMRSHWDRAPGISVLDAPDHSGSESLIAVVHGCDYVRRMVADGLTTFGFRVIDCPSVESLAHALAPGFLRPELLVLDVEGDCEHAGECHQRLDSAGVRVPRVVMLGGSAAALAVRSGRDDDWACDVLPKPCSIGAIRDAVRGLLQRPLALASSVDDREGTHS